MRALHSGIAGAAVLEVFAILAVNHFLPFFSFPAFEKAIAMAWFCGLPAFISVFILAEMTFLLDPFFNGILSPDNKKPALGG